MSELRRNILRGLRHGPLDYYQLAADLVEAAFTVRAELKALKRDRLVYEHISAEAHTWELTAAGERLAWSGDQLELQP